MGCDVHLFLEKKVGGKWVPADKWVQDEDDKARKTVPYGDRFYTGRNYDFFAILADVRNGRGFAGCDTGDGFVPMSEPKGLPEDVSEEIKNESDQWGEDGHSHSWHTVADLLAYDWTQVTRKRGTISAAEFLEWNRYRRGQGLGPDSYCGGVSGSGVTHISPDEMEHRIKEVIGDAGSRLDEDKLGRIREKLANLYCRVEWTEPYYAACPDFFSSMLPRLLALGKPEDVRIVFFFDN